MLELVIVACSVLHGAQCREITLTYSTESVTPLQCLMGAQPVIAEWVWSHPNWTVSKWSCRPAGRYAKV